MQYISPTKPNWGSGPHISSVHSSWNQRHVLEPTPISFFKQSCNALFYLSYYTYYDVTLNQHHQRESTKGKVLEGSLQDDKLQRTYKPSKATPNIPIRCQPHIYIGIYIQSPYPYTLNNLDFRYPTWLIENHESSGWRVCKSCLTSRITKTQE
jgi:hypothetical protein